MNTFEEDKTIDRSLLIYSEITPYCKEHGAMLLLNGIWRCYGTYKGNADSVFPVGIKPIKFIERTCNCAISDKEWNELKEFR
jgi:hypothetical protein